MKKITYDSRILSRNSKLHKGDFLVRLQVVLFHSIKNPTLSLVFFERIWSIFFLEIWRKVIFRITSQRLFGKKIFASNYKRGERLHKINTYIQAWFLKELENSFFLIKKWMIFSKNEINTQIIFSIVIL